MAELHSWEQALLDFSLPVQDEYQKVAPAVRARLTQEEYEAWVQEGSRLGQKAFRAWQAAVEYFRASPAVLEAIPFRRLHGWVEVGEALAISSAELASAYFRASPAALPHLSQGDLLAWAETCARLYQGEWQSGALAVKLFDASAQLLPALSISELDQVAHVLEIEEGNSHSLAQQCLDILRALLPRFEAPQREHILSLAAVLARRSPERAKEWLGSARGILARVEHTEQVRFLHIVEKLAWLERDQTSVMDYLYQGSAALDRLDHTVHAKILFNAEEVLNYSAAAAKEFVIASATLLERLHPNELEEWVEEGRLALREREDTGIAFFKLESGRAQEALRRLSRGVELSQVGEVLRLYCKALTGTDIQVQPTENLTHRGIGWTAENRPTTEGSNVFLPPFVQVYDSKQENFGALKVYATHQTAHLEFASFTFGFLREGILFPRLRGAVEETVKRHSTSITDIERFLDIFAVRRLASDIFTVAEDARIDGDIAREYGGIRSTLRRVQRDTTHTRPFAASLPLRTAVLEALLQWSLDPDQPQELPQRYHRHFRVACGFLAKLQRQKCLVEDSAEAVLRIYIVLRSIPNLSPEQTQTLPWTPVEVPPDLNPEEEMADLLTLQSSSGQALGSMLKKLDEEEDYNPYVPLSGVEYRGDFKPELVQTLMKIKEQNQADPNAPIIPLTPEEIKNLMDKLGETEIGEFLVGETDSTSGMFVTNLLREAGQKAVQHAGEVRPTEKGELEGDEMQTAAPLEYLYNEWDFRANDYRHNWCLVREKVLEEGNPAFYDEILKKHAKLAREVRRQFELLKPEMFKKIKNLTHGEEFDLDQVVQAVIDRKAKITPSEKIYWRRNKEERSVAVAFLLDVSASTDEDVKKEREPLDDLTDWDEDPRRYLLFFRERMQEKEKVRKNRRRIIDVEKESTVLLIQALETVGDAYGVYGFSGYGRDNVEVYVVKDLKESFSPTVKSRIEKMEPVRGTRMGAAIRHAISKLDAYDAKVKVLFLLSDGRPQDHNYGRDRTEKEYAIHDTKEALLEAKRKHIVPFALTVDREGHDYLKAMCDGIGYEVVEDIESLPARLPSLYRQLTF
ncbi:MAG: VWA domain-containing protein [Chloroflexi bacterium]|nr:VWA domain-containing protein [Chloroflexota bacterium]